MYSKYGIKHIWCYKVHKKEKQSHWLVVSAQLCEMFFSFYSHIGVHDKFLQQINQVRKQTFWSAGLFCLAELIIPSDLALYIFKF